MRTSAIGSLPGTDLGAGVRLALEAVSVPWLPEFPARGPWAGMVGRALGLLDGLGAELSAGEWRLAAVPAGCTAICRPRPKFTAMDAHSSSVSRGCQCA